MGTDCGLFCGTEPRYSADYQLINIEAISASHKAQHEHGYGKLIK